jgi:hypothetical protein
MAETSPPDWANTLATEGKGAVVVVVPAQQDKPALVVQGALA